MDEIKKLGLVNKYHHMTFIELIAELISANEVIEAAGEVNEGFFTWRADLGYTNYNKLKDSRIVLGKMIILQEALKECNKLKGSNEQLSAETVEAVKRSDEDVKAGRVTRCDSIEGALNHLEKLNGSAARKDEPEANQPRNRNSDQKTGGHLTGPAPKVPEQESSPATPFNIECPDCGKPSPDVAFYGRAGGYTPCLKCQKNRTPPTQNDS